MSKEKFVKGGIKEDDAFEKALTLPQFKTAIKKAFGKKYHLERDVKKGTIVLQGENSQKDLGAFSGQTGINNLQIEKASKYLAQNEGEKTTKVYLELTKPQESRYQIAIITLSTISLSATFRKSNTSASITCFLNSSQ